MQRETSGSRHPSMHTVQQFDLTRSGPGDSRLKEMIQWKQQNFGQGRVKDQEVHDQKVERDGTGQKIEQAIDAVHPKEGFGDCRLFMLKAGRH